MTELLNHDRYCPDCGLLGTATLNWVQRLRYQVYICEHCQVMWQSLADKE